MYATIQPTRKNQQHTTESIRAAILARDAMERGNVEESSLLKHEVVNVKAAEQAEARKNKTPVPSADWRVRFYYNDRVTETFSEPNSNILITRTLSPMEMATRRIIMAETKIYEAMQAMHTRLFIGNIWS